MDFKKTFEALTGHPPFPWQAALYERFLAGDIPAICSLPTGMGKTSIIAVWLVALALAPDKVPRRLVYVVNRRTVVDQTTDEVKKYREALKAEEPALQELWENLAQLCALSITDKDGKHLKDEDGKPVSPLAISTLRGQFADNREWSTDPARPAVICGTVDMIGSRLLFSGYGCGFKSKPLHAGFLGQDVLLVHDEAHLEPSFQELIEEIHKEQVSGERSGELPWKKLRVMELTATPRGRGEVFELSPADRTNATVRQRFEAKKAITLDPLKDVKKPGAEIAECALAHRESGTAVLVFARTVEDVMTVAEKLDKQKLPVVTLTGTMRGKERDDLVEHAVFARFLPPSNRPQGVTPTEGTVFLVCTSAGEVGVNISADHMVCDLSTFDSMAQRFGRVNRFGERDDATITVLHPTAFDPKDELDSRREKTLALLRKLNGDASPHGLKTLDATEKERTDAFTPSPTILPVTDILFDSWALTTIREKLPGRPPVEPYLHGLSSWEPPQTKVAWREEVAIINGALLKEYKPEDLLDVFPLKSFELLADRTDRVFDRLKKLPNGLENPSLPVWIVAEDGTVTPTTIGDIVGGDKQILEGATLLLPPSLGGLRDGMLNASSHVADDVSCDLYADKEQTQPLRSRWRSEESVPPKRPDAMRLVLRIDTRRDQEADQDDEEDETDDRPSNLVLGDRYLYWFERVGSGYELGGRTSKQAITWDHHTDDVTANAQRIADKLLANHPELHTALVFAAKWHDLGKRRDIWQRSIGRPTSEQGMWYAKSAPSWPSESIQTSYRHEFGSLVDIFTIPEVRRDYDALTQEIQTLVLHLIAVHHGYGRPHFPQDRAFDPEPKGYDTSQLASDIPRRFAKLQRQYGRWGLAYLESLLRAADAAASANPSEESLSAVEARS